MAFLSKLFLSDSHSVTFQYSRFCVEVAKLPVYISSVELL